MLRNINYSTFSDSIDSFPLFMLCYVYFTIAAVILFAIRKKKTLPQEAMCQHVVSPGWSSLQKSLEISGALAVIL